jgi:cytochrome c
LLLNFENTVMIDSFENVRWPGRDMRSATNPVLLLIVGLSLGQASSATAEESRGKEIFKTCHACHTIEQDGENMLGPNLWGVYGAKSASNPDFAYSAALKSSGIVWTEENLSKWLAGPTKFVPGSKMAFPGLPDEADRQAVIAYLKSNSG